MTARYFPASISSLRKRTSFLVNRGGIANRRSLFERHGGRLLCQRCPLAHADELGMSAESARTGAEDPVTDRELADRRADCCHLARELRAEDSPLRSTDARVEPAEKRDEGTRARIGFANPAVRPGDRRRVNLDEHLVFLGDGLRDVLESQNLRGTVPVVDNCSHAFTSPSASIGSAEPRGDDAVTSAAGRILQWRANARLSVCSVSDLLRIFRDIRRRRTRTRAPVVRW